jgi:replicative superfamily II helicase
MLSFENITISRFEGEHAKLKRALKTFIEDLKKVVNVIELILKNERSEYLIAHEEGKARLSRSCLITALKNLQVRRKRMFIRKFSYNLQIYISSYVLKLIRKQIDKCLRIRNAEESLSACTKIYETSMRLFCAHVVKRRVEKNDVLHLENVHSHWRIHNIDYARNQRVLLSSNSVEEMNNNEIRQKKLKKEEEDEMKNISNMSMSEAEEQEMKNNSNMSKSETEEKEMKNIQKVKNMKNMRRI